MPQWVDASSAIAAGVPTTIAESYLAPDGILPRMRLIACGWLKTGDSFKRPGDAWWKQPYRYALWTQLATYASAIAPTSDAAMQMDESVADGDIGAISQALIQVADELGAVIAEPCPKWIIPTGRGQMPIPNPKCIKEGIDKDRLREEIDKVHGRGGTSWLLWLIAAAYLLGRSRRK